MEVKQIPLTNSDKVALVDSADYDWLMQWNWRLSPNGYANRVTFINENPPRKNMMMHRQIINTPRGLATDHINGNRLDNRRCNLRPCTDGQNQRNRIKHKVATSIYKGVSKSSRGREGWETMLYVDGKRQYIGHYPTEIDAALAYNAAARKVFGEFARLNDVKIPEGFVAAPPKVYTSKYKGVCFNKKAGKWIVKIKIRGQQIYLGLFDDETEAALAYKNAAIASGSNYPNYNNKKLTAW